MKVEHEVYTTTSITRVLIAACNLFVSLTIVAVFCYGAINQLQPSSERLEFWLKGATVAILFVLFIGALIWAWWWPAFEIVKVRHIIKPDSQRKK